MNINKLILKIKKNQKRLLLIIISLFLVLLLIIYLATRLFSDHENNKNENIEPTVSPEPSVELTPNITPPLVSLNPTSQFKPVPSPTVKVEPTAQSEPTNTPKPTAKPTSKPTITPTPAPPIMEITYPVNYQAIEMREDQTFCMVDIPVANTDGLQRRHKINDQAWTAYQDHTTLCYRPEIGENTLQVQYRNSSGAESEVKTILFIFHPQ